MPTINKFLLRRIIRVLTTLLPSLRQFCGGNSKDRDVVEAQELIEELKEIDNAN